MFLEAVEMRRVWINNLMAKNPDVKFENPPQAIRLEPILKKLGYDVK